MYSVRIWLLNVIVRHIITYIGLFVSFFFLNLEDLTIYSVNSTCSTPQCCNQPVLHKMQDYCSNKCFQLKGNNILAETGPSLHKKITVFSVKMTTLFLIKTVRPYSLVLIYLHVE